LENWLSAYRRLKIDHHIYPSTKLNSIWVKNLNVGPKTFKLLQEKIGETLEDIDKDNYFLNRTPITQETGARTDKRDCIKLKSFCTSKDTITRTKRQSTKCENIFTCYSTDNRLISRIYKELKNNRKKDK
jgi:hypothetical protein